ncbi:hypothetical protein PIB30_016546 [Stylosanthes scabra]|uniref:DUF4283 domain-containing protein n=1 Tax=Stylosanthes scabra TaxID=79078 RepID=A0ABU6R7M7_9FABA|nr:hypothetical protein [Stylosanthes scabra]
MGPFMMVLTFGSVEDKDEARLSPLLLTYFGEIRNWSEQEANRTRKTRVEIYGMPIQAWSEQNFHKVATVLGTVVDIENVSSIGTNYSSVKANIVTSWLRPIHECVILELNEVLFEVFIAEIPEEIKYKCKIEDDVMLMKEAGDSKISGPNEEVAGNCEKSNSTRCIVDDRRSEDLIKETQMASSLGRNMKGPIQYNLEVEGLEVEPSSNP